MADSSSFGGWLRRRRKALDLSQVALATRAGCSESAIHMIETGVRRPSRQVALLLMDCLRVPVEEREDLLRLARVDERPAPASPQRIDAQAPSSTEEVELPVPTNLPRHLPHLFGREREVLALKDLLVGGESVVLTLTGPPGVGKTSLAMRTSSELLPSFRDGVYFVPLASIRETELVPDAVLGTLGIRVQAARAAIDLLIDQLRDKQMLLVLDNFEHLLEGAIHIPRLVTDCPHLRLLVTSRAPLRLSLERQFEVNTLPAPDVSKQVRAADLKENPSAELFVERARAVRLGFGVTDENAGAIASICAFVDGLPLALELVAARVKLMSPGQLSVRLKQQHLGGGLRLISGGPQDWPDRHRTLHDAIEWSYELLSPTEQLLFRRLAVFSGGFSLGAAEAVCNARDDLASSVLEGIASLLDKNLLKRMDEPNEGEDPRFRMLEVIREYSLERLEESGEAETVRRWHGEYFLALARAAKPELTGPNQKAWLDRLERDHDNFRSGLKWAHFNGDAEMVARVSGALGRFWLLHGHMHEGRRWVREAIRQRHGLAPAVEAEVLAAAGVMAHFQGDLVEARSLLEDSLSLCRGLGDELGMANALKDLGNVVSYQGDLEGAKGLYSEGLEGFRRIGNSWGIGACLSNLGIVAQEQGDLVAAEQLYGDSLEIRRRAGDRWGVAASLNNLGMVALHRGDYARATSLWEGSLVLLREMGNRQNIAVTLNHLGEIAKETGDLGRALSLFEEGLVICREIGDKRGTAVTLGHLGDIAARQNDYLRAGAMHSEELALVRDMGDKIGIVDCLDALAAVASGFGQPERAALLLGAVDAARKEMKLHRSPARQASKQRLQDELRIVLEGKSWEREYVSGQRTSLEEAVDLALDVAISAQSRRSG